MPHSDIFIGDSEMAQLMRGHDWAATPLGQPETWPSGLKSALRLLLTSRFDMWLGWGPEIHFFYNDAYRPTLGNKHPRSLGMPTRVLWAEIWDDIKGRLAAVYERGEATWDQALLLMLERNGYLEETYHTFSYSPLTGDTGQVEGVFCAVSEETLRVISERRLATLRELASALTDAVDRKAVMHAACEALAANRHDLPFSLIYLFDRQGGAELACASGIEAGSAAAPERIAETGGLWELSSALEGAGPVLIPAPASLALPQGAWSEPPTTVAVVPLVGQGEQPRGALIVGLNRYRPADDDYLGFLSLLAGQITSGLASTEALEAERRRAEVLAEAVRLRQEAAEALSRANAQLSSEVEIRTRERDRVQALFRQAPSFMCILTGPDHVFALVNDAYLTLVGHRDLVGLPIRQALPDIAGQGYFELLDRVYSTGEAFVGRNLSVAIQREPGGAPQQRYVNLVYQPIKEADGSVWGIFVDGFDTTHQKRAEDQLQHLNETLEQRVQARTDELSDALRRLQSETADRLLAEAALRQSQKIEALGKLTGGVAHDFNNLLQVIGGNLQLLSKDIAGNPRAETRVQNALAGVSRGAKLASQLLAFARKQPLEPKVVNLGRLLQNMDDLLRRALGEDIAIETIGAGGLWNTLVDPGQIENAILNLAINARDAMKDGGRLTIEVGNVALDEAYARQHDDVKPGQYVMIAVTDTGTGIPKEIIDQVFEPFFSTKAEGKGTGLGLSMVHGLVKQSGGHIKVYSEVGEGTTIKLYFPRASEAEDLVADARDVPVRGGTETVLVAEDDDEVRETTVGLLSDLGYRVLKARDAQSALNVIESGVPIDLLFTDVVMPGTLRSPDLARKVKERLPHIAVLFTSGYTENAIVHHGRLDPGVELLSKPYTREALARKIRHVLGNEAQRSSAAAGRTGPSASEGHAPLTIVLVEDDDLIRANTAETLRDMGYTVAEAADGPAAVEALSTQGADVLITDVGLPGMSGIALANQAILRWPGLRIVFASGDEATAASSGIRGAMSLRKPYTPEDLSQALKTVLSQQRGTSAS